ncbi:MAG: hypothetical protein AAGJ35_16085 [Myxococcota bacterium]
MTIAPHEDATCTEVTKQLQQAVDAWEGRMRATGGALVPHKCFWYPLEYAWAGTQWTFVEDRSDLILTILDKDQRLLPVKKYGPQVAQRTLGVHISPALECDKHPTNAKWWKSGWGRTTNGLHDQAQVLASKIDGWLHNLKSVSLTPSEVFFGYTCTLLKNTLSGPRR